MITPKPIYEERLKYIRAFAANLPNTNMLSELLAAEAYWRGAVRTAESEYVPGYDEGTAYALCPWCKTEDEHKLDCPRLIAELIGIGEI